MQCLAALTLERELSITENAKIITERSQVSETQLRAAGEKSVSQHVTMQSLSNIIQAYFEIFQPNTCPIVSNVQTVFVQTEVRGHFPI